jgi:hypothetical protein
MISSKNKFNRDIVSELDIHKIKKLSTHGQLHLSIVSDQYFDLMIVHARLCISIIHIIMEHIIMAIKRNKANTFIIIKSIWVWDKKVKLIGTIEDCLNLDTMNSPN